MNKLTRIITLAALILTMASCAGNRNKSSEDDLGLEDGGATASPDNSQAAAPSSNAADDFADFEDTPAASSAPAPAEAAAAPVDDLNVDAPIASQPSAPEVPVAVEPTPEPSPFPEAAPTTDVAPPVAEQPSVPEPTPAAPVSAGLATITGLKYKANDNGGTVLIEANAPITYTTRVNPDLHQLIVEVPGSILPRRLQRPLNTRDIQGSIGSIDPYQNAGSNVSRFVLQLRPGAGDPVVQQEGNTILVVASAAAASEQAAVPLESSVNVDMNDSKILESQSLAEYLTGNTKFYGKKISIETGNNMDIRDALRFIMEESGVNMVVSEDVKGSVNLKLRQVPWDQALVMILKAKQLGYTRQGNVLRIAPIDQLRKEEETVGKMVLDKQKTETLTVRMFSLSYAQAADIEKKAKDFLSTRGKVVGDVRTNSIVVTDIAENVDRVARLIQGLDIQPQQVLIEGKIIEAQDNFQRNIGINWGFNGQDVKLASNKNGPVNLHPTLAINPGPVIGGALTSSMTLGTFDGLGDLNATLSLYEKDEKIKVVSSPRVVTMSNEKAYISQTTEVPVRQVTQNGTVTQTTFTFKPLALKLEVTPQITSDGSIIMLLNVKREFPGATDASSGSFAVNSREASTKVLVKNGQTSVIGGIYQNDETGGETGVPYLRNIPVLGALFRGRTTDRKKSELLVFLTPRILMSAETRGDAATEIK